MKALLRPALLALTVLALLPLAACRRGGEDAGGYRVSLEVSPSPPRVGPATVSLTLRDPWGKPVEGARIEVEANMSHAGMVPVVAEAREVSPGVYRADLRFTMAGDWFLVVRAALPDGGRLEKTVDVRGVRPREGR